MFADLLELGIWMDLNKGYFLGYFSNWRELEDVKLEGFSWLLCHYLSVAITNIHIVTTTRISMSIVRIYIYISIVVTS